MRNYVVDANILMSILISGKADYRPLLSYFNFILPDFALVELEKYSHILKAKTRLKEEELTQWSFFVFSELTILPRYVIQPDTFRNANNLVASIDPKDVSYIALAIQLDLPILTRDQVLHHGLRKQGFRRSHLFEDF